jgi:alkylation response protein AidB-like acyl-CoA dehydrogenase
MDLRYSTDEQAFRAIVRTYLEANLPADLQHKVRSHLRMSKDDSVRWHKILAEKGWVAPGWPQEFGGPGVISSTMNAPALAHRRSCRLA